MRCTKMALTSLIRKNNTLVQYVLGLFSINCTFVQYADTKKHRTIAGYMKNTYVAPAKSLRTSWVTNSAGV
jgi:hypothetical protein